MQNGINDLHVAEAVAYAIADNRTGDLAEWDDPELAAVLTALQEDDAMASGEREQYQQTKEEARQKAHVDAEHALWLASGLRDSVERILLATDAIVEHGRRIAFVEDFFTIMRTAVNEDHKIVNVEKAVEASWEKWRGK